jgi:hypothetical protein
LSQGNILLISISQMSAISSTECIHFRETDICLLVKVQYHVRKSQALVRNARQINLNSHTHILFKIYFNNMFPRTPAFTKWRFFPYCSKMCVLLVFPIPPAFHTSFSVFVLLPVYEFFFVFFPNLEFQKMFWHRIVNPTRPTSMHCLTHLIIYILPASMHCTELFFRCCRSPTLPSRKCI